MRSKNGVYATRRTNVVFMILLLGGLLVAGCSGQQDSPPPPVPEVAVITVRSHEIVLTSELPGRTSSFRVAEIRPQVSGLIQRRLFTEGADVTAGQILYQIDPAHFQAALDNAEAALGKAEANLSAVRSRADRFQELLAVKAVSRQDYDDAAAALKQTEADIAYWKAKLEEARINLRYTRITAPISGRIGRSSVTEGALVTAYQPVALATIQQMDPIYVDVPQSTADTLRLRQRLENGRLYCNVQDQREVGLLLEDGTPYPLKGTLQFRDVTVDSTTGSVILRIVFPNPDAELLPNMFVRAILRECVAEKAILIPQQSVSRDPKGNPYTLIVNAEDKVEQRPLELDRAIGNDWLVSSGLAPGERVIVEGIQKVRPGSPVKTVSAPDTGANNPEAGTAVQHATPSN